MSDEQSREEQQQVFRAPIDPSTVAPLPPNVSISPQLAQQLQQQLPPQQQSARDQIPVDIVALPSKGLAYSLDHPLCNAAETEIRCMTAREEDILTSRALIKNGTVMTKLLEACMMNKMVDPEDLLLGDRNALLIAVRVTGYGPAYSAKVMCPECRSESEQEFVMNALKIKPLGAKPAQPNTNLFEYKLPMSRATVHFKLMTGRDDSELTKTASRRKKLKTEIDNIVTDKLIHTILSVNGNPDKGEIVKFVQQMTAGDARSLRSYMNKIEPDIDMRQWYSCPSCGEEVEVEIPLGISFFWPDDEY